MNNLKISKNLINGSNPISNFIPELNTESTLLSKTDKRNIDGILYLMTHVGEQRFRHKVYHECIAVSQDELYEIFGQYNYRINICNNRSHILNKLLCQWHVGNKADGKGSSAFGTSDYFDKAYLEWTVANEKESTVLIDTKIKSKHIDQADIHSHIFIDVDAMKKRMEFIFSELRVFLDAYRVYEKSNDLNDEQVLDAIKMIDRNHMYKEKLLHEVHALKYVLAQTIDGNKIELQYKTSNSGRYYGFGRYNIQSIKKDMRNLMLNNYYSYDIESASPVILSQIYTRITGEQTPKSIQYYIDNKSAFRVALALYLDISIDDAKMIFNMLFFGARTNENDIFHKTSIGRLIGENLNRALLNNRYFKPLVRDIKMMFKIIGDYYKEHHSVRVSKKWIIQNDKGREIVLDKWDNGKVVAHVYQGVESIILDTCIDYYKSKHDDASYLLIHDGFYALHELDTDDLQQCIFNETGFRIDYKQRQETLTKSQVLKTFGVYDIAVSKCEAIQKEKMAS